MAGLTNIRGPRTGYGINRPSSRPTRMWSTWAMASIGRLCGAYRGMSSRRRHLTISTFHDGPAISSTPPWKHWRRL